MAGKKGKISRRKKPDWHEVVKDCPLKGGPEGLAIERGQESNTTNKISLMAAFVYLLNFQEKESFLQNGAKAKIDSEEALSF